MAYLWCSTNIAENSNDIYMGIRVQAVQARVPEGRYGVLALCVAFHVHDVCDSKV